MFTNAELALIKELREVGAPIERWAAFFPDHKISDLTREYKPEAPLYRGWPVASSEEYCDLVTLELEGPEGFAKRMKKGNIYRWDKLQDEFLTTLYCASYNIPNIINLINLKFGIKRTTGAITSRLQHLGLM